MTDPATPYTITIGVIAVTGSIFGMQADALLVGLLGGFVALRYAGTLTIWGLVGSLTTAVILAGALSPVANAAALHYADWLAPSKDAVRLACAFVLGLTAQVVLPISLKILRKRFGVDGDGSGDKP
jgi:hypothetical protein